MKKLIVFAVVFALLAGAAFAQVQIDAGGAFKFDLMSMQSGAAKAEKDSGGKAINGIGAGFGGSWWWLSGKKTNDDGTMGAKASVGFNTDSGGVNFGGGEDEYIYVWWQPIEQLFVKVGKVGEDGKYWAGAGVVGWDFQSNDLLMSPDFGYYNGFAGSLLSDSHGYIATTMGNIGGLQLSILPIDGLAINLGWDLTAGGLRLFYDTLNVQAVYTINGAGTAAIGYVNNAEYAGDQGYHQFAAQYAQPIGDKMKVEVGVSTKLRDKNGTKVSGDGDGTQLWAAPIDMGIGFGYGSPWGDDFWLNARIGVSLGMKTKWKSFGTTWREAGLDHAGPTIIGLDICPSYDLGAFRVYFPVGFAMAMGNGINTANVSGHEKVTLFAWSVNPYIRKQMGGLEFWAGIKLYNGMVNADGSFNNWYPEVGGNYGQHLAKLVRGDGKKVSSVVNFSIPIGFLWAW